MKVSMPILVRSLIIFILSLNLANAFAIEYVGNRLISLVANDLNESPAPLATKQIFKECKFTSDASDRTVYQSRDCVIQSPTPSKLDNQEHVSIVPYTATCCLISLKISQLKADTSGGLELFNIPNVTKTKLSCPKIEAASTAHQSNFYLISKENKPKFVIREDEFRNRGAETSINTTIYFNKYKADCLFFEQAEKDLANMSTVVYLEPKKIDTPKPGSVQNNKPSSPRPSTPSATNSSGRYTNLVACIHPYVKGIAAQMVTTLLQVASDSPMAFGNVITNPTYAKYCQMAYGVPGSENVQMSRIVSQNGNTIYRIADRGFAAVGFVEHR